MTTDPVNKIEEAKDDYQKASPASEAVVNALSPVLKGEPAVILGTVVGVVIAGLALLGVLPVDTSVGVVTSVAPVLGGLITRFFVKPATS